MISSYNSKYSICVLILLFWSVTHLTAQSLIGKANHVFEQHRPQEASRLYQQVLKNADATPQNKAFAAQRLIHIEGHLYKNIEKARYWAQEGLKANTDQSKTYRTLAIIETENGQFAQAKAAAKQAIKTAQSKADPLLAKEVFCKAVLVEQNKLLQQKKSLNIGEIKKAKRIIEEVIQVLRTTATPFKIKMGLALLTQDGSSVYQAWRGFFLLSKGDSPTNIMKNAHHLVKQVCKKWQGNTLTQTQAQKLFLGLFQSRLFWEAQTLQNLYPSIADSPTNKVKEAIAYTTFVTQIQQQTFTYYLTVVKDGEVNGKLRKMIMPLIKKLWEDLSWKDKPGKFSWDALIIALGNKFGAEYASGKTNGYLAFYGGHAIQDQTKAINQYGKKGEIRYVSLDGIVANDFTGWYRNHIRVGGWARKNRFVRLRPAYARVGLRQWSILTDKVEQQKFLANLEQKLKEDELTAKKNPHTYLPGVVRKIEYRELKKIFEEVKSKAKTQDNLQLKFIKYMKNLTKNSSIFIHEGRHVIDKNLSQKFTSAELEYRAKLSEVALSPYPMYVFIRQVMMHNIGSHSSHGQGNLMVVKNLTQWMESNAASIKGFDKNRPTLAQIDLLTDTQLKTALQSVDPLAQQKH